MLFDQTLDTQERWEQIPFVASGIDWVCERDDIQSTNEAGDETGDLWMRCRREKLSTGLARLRTRSEIL